MPPGRVESLGCSHRAPQAVVSSPLLQNIDFRRCVATNWRSVLSIKHFVHSLSLYCIICGQWVSANGGIKQHMRLMHAEQWVLKDEAASRCSSTGLTIAIFQSSLAALLVVTAQEHGNRGPEDGRDCSQGGGGDLRTFVTGGEGEGTVTFAPRLHQRSGGTCRPPAEVEQAGLKRQCRELRQGQLPWLAKGKGPLVVRAHTVEHSGAGVPEKCGSDADEARVRDEASSPRHDVDDVCGHQRDRHSCPASTEVNAVAADVPAEAGDHQPEGRATDLRVPGTGHATPGPHGGLGEAHPDALGRVACGGRQCHESQVGLPAILSPEKQAVELSQQPPITFTLAQEAIQAVINNVGGQGVLLRLRSTRPLTEKITGEVLPFALVLSLRGNLAMQFHQALHLLTGSACLKVAGLRIRPDRGQQSKLAKELEASYSGLSFADWNYRKQPWEDSGRQAAQGSEQEPK